MFVKNIIDVVIQISLYNKISTSSDILLQSIRSVPFYLNTVPFSFIVTVGTIPYFLYLSTNQILVYNIIYILNRTKDNMYSFIVRKRKKKRCNVKASSQVDWLEVFQIDSRWTRENFECNFRASPLKRSWWSHCVRPLLLDIRLHYDKKLICS